MLRAWNVTSRFGWLVLAALSSLLLLASCNRDQVSGQGTSAQNRHLLFDFREMPAPSAGKESSTGTPAVLAALFPGYSQQTGGCKPVPGEVNATPAILGSAEGAFTQKDASQTAYLIDVGGCQGDTGGFGSARLAIFTGNELVTSARVNATQLLGTYDLDNNGLFEFLLANANVQEGGSTVAAFLMILDKSTYRVAENFGRVRYETCGTPEGTLTAAKVDYLPEVDLQTGKMIEKMPRFTAELYRSLCPKNSGAVQWVRVQGN